MTCTLAEAINILTFKENSVKIQCIDSDMFRVVQKHFAITGTDFYTFPTTEERTLKVVIKGLPTDITTEKLNDELKSKVCDVTFAKRFI